MTERFSKLYQNKWVATVRSFVDGPFFPVLTGGIALLCYLLSRSLLGLAIFLTLAVFILFFSEDTRAILPLAFYFFFMLEYHDNVNLYLSKKALIVYLVFGIPFVLGWIFRLIAFPRNHSKRRLLLGLALMCVGFLLGGAFSGFYRNYDFYKGIGLTVAFCLPYMLFSLTMRYREDTAIYISRIFAVVICMIALQLLRIYILHYEWGSPLNDLWKGQILFGWGISNTAGELLAFFMPAVFYLIHKEKKGYFYYAVVAIAYVAIWFTLSRNALLFGTFTLGCGVLLSCFIGRHKKLYRYIVLGLFVLFVVLLIVLVSTDKFEQLFTFFVKNKFGDRGRFKLWKEYVAQFKKHPIFGVGYSFFKKLYHNPWVKTAWQAHNTPIQVLGSTGLVGFVFYLFHRTQTVLLLCRKPKTERLFLGGCIAVGLLQSLLDPLFFRLYFAIFYSVLLFVIEQSYEEDKKKDKEKTSL